MFTQWFIITIAIVFILYMGVRTFFLKPWLNGKNAPTRP